MQGMLLAEVSQNAGHHIKGTMQRSRCDNVTDWVTIKQYRTTMISLRSKHELHRCSCHIFPSHQCYLIHRQCSGQAALATFCSLSNRATAPLATAVLEPLCAL
jgi:hypothetical protein